MASRDPRFKHRHYHRAHSHRRIPALMPTYEVRRRTVLTFSVVQAANETEARCLARDAWQQDAAIAALAADVTRRPMHEPYDRERDNDTDFGPLEFHHYRAQQDEDADDRRIPLGGAVSDSEAEPWP